MQRQLQASKCMGLVMCRWLGSIWSSWCLRSALKKLLPSCLAFLRYFPTVSVTVIVAAAEAVCCSSSSCCPPQFSHHHSSGCYRCLPACLSEFSLFAPLHSMSAQLSASPSTSRHMFLTVIMVTRVAVIDHHAVVSNRQFAVFSERSVPGSLH